MKINVDRLCQLAGVGGSSSSNLLRESAYDAMEEKAPVSDMFAEAMEEEADEEEDNLDEMIEIDEVELVQELRRMKRLMNENKKRQTVLAQKAQAKRRQALQEAHLKTVIEEEVQNIMDELNISADWVYGNDKPKQSRKGFVHQGSFLKGIGFK
jgi:hypothetical protein